MSAQPTADAPPPPPPPSLPARLSGAEALPLVPGVVLVGIVIAWAASGGGYESLPALDAGYDPGPWYLGALALTGLLWVTAAGLGSIRLSRWSAIACAALGGYVVWSYLSMLWANDQALAFLGSNRALVYFASFATFAILAWRNWSARLMLGLLAGGLSVLAVVVAVKVAVLADPGSLYIRQRLAWPLGYYNADAALFTMAAVVAIALSAQRCTPAVPRVAGSVGAAVCLQLAVLSQSRGWLFTAPLVLLAALLLVPDRLRLLVATLPVAVAVAVVTPALLRVYSRSTPGGNALPQPHLSQVLHQQGSHAVKAMLIADVALALVSALLVFLDQRVRLGVGARRRIDRLAVAGVTAVVLAGAVAGLVAVKGDPVGRVERAWHSFADAGGKAETSGSHFGTLASHRADIWRVALDEFAHHPLAGIGQDNFATSYTRLRRSDEQPRWVHSIELRLLAHTGLVGALLFVLFAVAALLAALRGRPRGSAERATAGMLLLPAVVWLAQGSLDWFWEYPALSVPALACAGAAGALASRSRPLTEPRPPTQHRPPERGGRARTLLAWSVGGALALASMAALTVPFLAARHAQRATQIWPDHPLTAYRELRSATGLMPFDSQLYLVGGAIALNLGELEYARSWFRQAGSREPQNWLVPFSLGLIDGERGRLARARVELLRALALNPTEPLVLTAVARLRDGRPLTFAEAQSEANPHIVTPNA
jgi:hypothetical protein